MRGGTRRWVALWLVGAAGCALVRAPAPPPITDGVQVGVASWYGPGFHGNRTANGEIYDQYELTAAHPSLPLGTRVMVTNLENGRAVQVRINDRGPFVGGRAIDLSYAAARTIGMVGPGTVRVRVEVLGSATLVAAAPAAAPVAAPETVRRGLVALRGLAFTTPVPVLALSRDGLGAVVKEEIEQGYSPGDIEHAEAVYQRLGLLPPGTQLRNALEQLYQQEGAGFYDPRTKRLVVAESVPGARSLGAGLLGLLTGRDPVSEFLIAHELTHALQDQHYHLPTRPEPLLDGHGDRELARHALLEGDATLAGFAYVLGQQLDRRMIGVVEQQLHGIPGELAKKYPDLPELLRASVAFQYDDGTTFVGQALAAGGWAAVDRVHLDPPESTEQVLHPQRYYDDRDRPIVVTLRGTDRLEATGFTRILEDTIGELGIRVLATRALPAERAVLVAAGWGGDRLRALQRGADLVLVWMTAWDSPADAGEFADALPGLVADARVERREERVLVLLGPPGLDRAALAGRVWSRTTAARPPGSAVQPEAVRPGTGHEAGVRREDDLQRGHGPQARGAACCCKAGASFL